MTCRWMRSSASGLAPSLTELGTHVRTSSRGIACWIAWSGMQDFTVEPPLKRDRCLAPSISSDAQNPSTGIVERRCRPTRHASTMPSKTDSAGILVHIPHQFLALTTGPPLRHTALTVLAPREPAESLHMGEPGRATKSHYFMVMTVIPDALLDERHPLRNHNHYAAGAPRLNVAHPCKHARDAPLPRGGRRFAGSSSCNRFMPKV